MTITSHIGDCRDILKTLPEGHFHTCVTSPPYFGLRDYGTAEWEGGDAGCEHIERQPGRGSSTLTSAGIGQTDEGQAYKAQKRQYRDMCGKCGARRIDRQIGLEQTPEAFVAELVAVFREVRRVLRDDGTVWLNLGDSYAAARGGTHQPAETLAGGKGGKTANGERVNRGRHDGMNPARNAAGIGLKHKDLIGIPWRVAFALQADGWYLRQDIIWAKPNPMPESVKDRCTKAHEFLFLLSKRPKYYFDQAAIAEPLADASIARLAQDIDGQRGSDRVPGKTNGAMKAVSGDYGHGAGRNDGDRHPSGGWKTGAELRNRRSVWTVATQPFTEAHFATFPPALIEPCILAGAPAECCAGCGAPYERQVERTAMVIDRSERTHSKGRTRASGTMLEPPRVETTGFAPSCACNVQPAPGRVLDPFGGAGTTGLVADRLQRNATLIELNPEYAAMSRDRIIGDAPLFSEVVPA